MRPPQWALPCRDHAMHGGCYNLPHCGGWLALCGIVRPSIATACHFANGADVYAEDGDGETPLHYADHAKMEALLREHGAE